MTKAQRLEKMRELIYKLEALNSQRELDLEAINRVALELTWYSAGWRVNGK